MKPKLLIALAVLLSLLLMGWIYSYFAGADARADIFNALNFGDTGGENVGLGDFFQNDSETNTEISPLRQLSLRRIIDVVHIEATASSSALVYATEAGTGHIYAINPDTGEETRLSNITTATAREALFSDDGRYAAISPADGNTLTLITLPHGSTTLDSFTIEAKAFSFSLTNSGILLYAEQEGSAVVAYTYDITTKKKNLLFTVPFREATIVWGASAQNTHLVYPRTSSRLEGYLYKINNGSMTRLAPSGYGLSANGNSSYALFTKRVADSYQTSLFNLNTNVTTGVGFSFLPEKCAFHQRGILCAYNQGGYGQDSPDNWYSGEVSHSDEFWYTDFSTSNSSFIINLESLSGRPLDVTSLLVAKDASAALFINKNDHSLWIYEGDIILNSGDN